MERAPPAAHGPCEPQSSIRLGPFEEVMGTWVTTEATLRPPGCKAGASPLSDLGDSFVWAPPCVPVPSEMRPQRGVKQLCDNEHREEGVLLPSEPRKWQCAPPFLPLSEGANVDPAGSRQAVQAK